MKTVKFGVIGLGHRGFAMLRDVLIPVEGVEFVAVCDEYADRAESAAKLVEEKKGKRPAVVTTDYREVLTGGKVDAVYIATSWETHIGIAIDAMRAKVAVALEVGGAYDLRECFDLVAAYEETKTPFMLMENCCFAKEELLATAMARAGKFGEIVHCSGAYGHDLRGEITGGYKNRHYRLRNYRLRCAENYPTHELGPIARLLNINRGNRMVSLTSVASKAAGLRDYIKDRGEEIDPTIRDYEWQQGDIVTTTIRCAGGETIVLTLDTTLPRYYNRAFTVRGTRGMFEAAPYMVYLDGQPEYFDTTRTLREQLGNAAEYEKEFLPPVWKSADEGAATRSHGGIDDIEFEVFFDALREGKPMPIDVYDAAAWMCITALSEASIAAGGQAQAIPDFTDGMWTRRDSVDVVPMK